MVDQISGLIGLGAERIAALLRSSAPTDGAKGSQGLPADPGTLDGPEPVITAFIYRTA